MFDLSSKIIIITGGAGLLGSRLAEIIISNNGTPIILDNDNKKIIKLKKNVNKKNLIECHKVDITNKKQIKKTIDKIYKKYKKIDCLINNAGYNPKLGLKNNKFENLTIKQWEKEIKIGLTGSLVVTQETVKKMIKQRNGNIINISSDLGVIAPNQTLYSKNNKKPISYSVVKHGIIGFSKYLATYLAEYNIRSNSLCPGGISNNQPKEFISKIKKLIPLKRMAKINDYDGIILYLCSDYSSYMTGSTIVCDGGRSVW
ncbi:SDR family oxidoreductase [Candidatus Pelagibacter communis]|uniref:SDR family oxidoreductase n=1 Tax=Pelagibacter ubique TaxID=198252 RepID=UPI000426BD77|nr:SDR family oxidoreductase [Candidatus Pelagibacter ubique]